MIRKTTTTLAILLGFGIIGLFFIAGKIADQQMNVLERVEWEPLDDATLRFHKSLIIADWHADNLLWDRNPLTRLDHGHIDIPRLIEGNISLQVFDAVTKTPRGLNHHRNKDNTDNITFLAIANRWPINTWSSLLQRALYQSKKLHHAAEKSEGRLKIIKSSDELRSFLTDRATNKNQVGGILALEGLHTLEGSLENLDKLHDAGFRIMGLTHFFDNEIGGSSAGVDQYGLSPFGSSVIKKMNEQSIIIDLAHASPELIDDVLSLSTRPVVVTHTGVRGTYDSPRNLSDDHIIKISATGGVIGIGFWDEAVGSSDLKSIARAMRYVSDLVGVEHVCLGSDWDGATSIRIGANDITQLTHTLLQEGFTEGEIRQIMGENQIRFLLENL